MKYLLTFFCTLPTQLNHFSCQHRCEALYNLVNDTNDFLFNRAASLALKIDIEHVKRSLAHWKAEPTMATISVDIQKESETGGLIEVANVSLGVRNTDKAPGANNLCTYSINLSKTNCPSR